MELIGVMSGDPRETASTTNLSTKHDQQLVELPMRADRKEPSRLERVVAVPLLVL